MTTPGMRRRGQDGSITPLLVGFALILATLAGVVVDASAAYLRHQSLDSIADAAALAATDGLQGNQVYTHGLGDRARIDPQTARTYVADYLASSGAAARYPGLTYDVATTATTVVVHVRAPMSLPLHVAGVGDTTEVSAVAASVVVISD